MKFRIYDADQLVMVSLATEQISAKKPTTKADLFNSLQMYLVFQMERLVSSNTRARLLTVRCISKLTLPIRNAYAPEKSDGFSINYRDQMYKEWLNNPQSVHKVED